MKMTFPLLHLLRASALFLLLGLAPASAQPGSARFVWTDAADPARITFAYFRYELDLAELPGEATFHLYASNLYHFRVNGTMVNMGPVRTFADSPRYDSYDLAPYLQKGRNIIAVKVLRESVYNYQMPEMPGGFIAWGNIGGQDLATPGKWLGTRSEAHNPHTPKFSFATGPMEMYDGRKEVPYWDRPFPAPPATTRKGRPDSSPAAQASTWKAPVPVANPAIWGTLMPRPIPHLTQKELAPKFLLGVYSFDDSEDLYSFHSKTPDEVLADYNRSWPHVAYTYIYSPREQEVETGSFWGSFYLNGELVEARQETKKNNAVRYERTFRFRQGWNYLFIWQKEPWGAWDCYLAFPKTAGLVVSATRSEKGEGPIFRVAGPFSRQEDEQLEALPKPFEPEALPAGLSATWKDHFRQPVGANPARDAAWLEFAEKQVGYSKHQTQNIQIPANQNRALVFDLGRKTLGRILLEVDAPEGTVFDVIISEDLSAEKVYVFKRIMISAGSRFIATEGFNRFEHFKPYGMRFVQLNVRNHTGPVTIRKIAATEQIYPFEKKGSFTCSDPYFNDLWEMGWRTLQVCAEDTYTDTPFRERGLYAGDMLPEWAITLVASADHRLIEHSFSFLNGMYADRQEPGVTSVNWTMGRMYDFPFAALHAWYWSYKTGGDKAFAQEQWRRYKHLVDWSFARQDTATGLLWAEGVFIEWTKLEKKDTYNTAYNASVAGACRALAEVATELGYGQHVADLQQKADRLAASINQHLWDEAKGAYWDGINSKGEKMATYYPVSSAYCSLFGIAGEQQKKRILKHYAQILPDIGTEHRAMLSSTYGSFYVLADLFQQEDAGQAEAFYRKYWLPQVEWADTNFEDFRALDRGMGSTLSHAWSGHATYFLSSEILGVQMGFPQPLPANKIVIAPQSETINWAKGTVPHPLGLVSVEWEVKGDLLFLHYDAPPGVKVEVKPRGRLAKLQLRLKP